MSITQTRSPIKDRPLRLPGQSLEEERNAIWEDKIEPYALIALFFVAFAAIEWWRLWTSLPPVPWPLTGCALLMVLLTAWRVWRRRPRMRAIRQGIDGEKAVGQFLERPREAGYHVFHDVLGPTFNVDHVLVGPAGVFTIETKTWSKPSKGDSRVTADDRGLLVAGHRPERDLLVQARSQASWIHHQIKESTGRSFTVKPVIVFPGWFIDPSAQRFSNLWVLEPKALPGFLEKEPLCIEPSDVKLAAFHLSRMIRSGERE